MSKFVIGTLGVTADRVRRISPGTEYNNLFPGFRGTDPIVNKNAEVHDTLHFVKKVVMETLSDTNKLSKKLTKDNVPATLKAVFDFFYKHYQYKLDAYGVEQVRRPARAWADRAAGIDCDCFSTSVSSILVNLGIDHYLKIIGINGRNHFQHIYVIIPKFKNADINVRSNYWVIDPVLNSFDEEAPNITKKDHLKMNGIPLQYLNGLGSGVGTLGKEFDYLNKESVNGLGEVSGDHFGKFRAAMHSNVINTYKKVENQPHSVEMVYKPDVLLGMLGKLEKAFHGSDEELLGTLEQLSMQEDQALQPVFQGMGAMLSDVDMYDAMVGDIDDNMIGAVLGDLGGRGRANRQAVREAKRANGGSSASPKRSAHRANRIARKAAPAPVAESAVPGEAAPSAEMQQAVMEGLGRAKKRGGFFTKTKNALKKVKNTKAFKAIKKVAHIVRKVNPLAAAARGGFLLALRTNFGHMAEKAYWGYKTLAEAKAKGITESYWRKCVELLGKIKKIIVERLGGEEKAIQKAILNGRAAKKIAKTLKGLGMIEGLEELSGFSGLGSATASAAGVTAALSFITPILAWIKKNFKKEKSPDTKGSRKKRGKGGDDAVENENGTTSEAPTDDASAETEEALIQAKNPDDTTIKNDGSVEEADAVNSESSEDGGEKKKLTSRKVDPNASSVRLKKPAEGEEGADEGGDGGEKKGMSTGMKAGLAALVILGGAGLAMSVGKNKPAPKTAAVAGLGKAKSKTKKVQTIKLK